MSLMSLFSPSAQIPGSAQQDLTSIVEAINRVQAVIWFELDGTILKANDNFLDALGYSSEEIVGQHHRMFCEPAYAETEEYTKTWEKLGRGEIHSGEFKRLTKDGKEIWIEASYNPVFDADGKPVKVVKFAIDITEIKEKAADCVGQLAAISKSQAVIEFNMDGTIRTANENFLKTLSYQLDEVKGQHHSIFIPATEKNSPEYVEFWRALGRGEFHAAEYKRIDKNGDTVWIQATYNPIFDPCGKPYKVVKFATDITVRKNAIECIARSLGELSNGDLSTKVDQSVDGDFAPLRDAFNETVDRLSKLVSQIQGATTAMTGETTFIARSSRELSARTERQAASLEETAAAMEQISATIKSSAVNASSADQAAIKAASSTERGSEVVSEAGTAMDRIEESSSKISEITSVIESISFQTNLLALNAAVEAARAGDAGKGFAVVASEVRTLAQRSSDAAKDITALIQTSTSHVTEGASLVRQAGAVLTEVNQMVATVGGNIRDISTASQEQNTGFSEVTSALSDIDNTTQKNAQLSEQSAANASRLVSVTEQLTGLIKFFSGYDGEERDEKDWEQTQRRAG